MRCLIESEFNVSKSTFVATILFGAKAAPTAAATFDVKTKGRKPNKPKCFLSLLQPSVVLPGPLSTHIKQLIWGYAGVRSGKRWRIIESAAQHLGCYDETDKGQSIESMRWPRP